MNYHHLDQNDRNLIQHFFNVERNSISEIARKWKKNKSTIARELNAIIDMFFMMQKSLIKMLLIVIEINTFLRTKNTMNLQGYFINILIKDIVELKQLIK